ncbi:unnamed protein product, partial [Bubo scandiacus]
ALIFTPCMIPCFIRLIHSVVKGMQIATIPVDPEKVGGGTTHSLMILKLKKEDKPNLIQQTLARFENQAQIN